MKHAVIANTAHEYMRICTTICPRNGQQQTSSANTYPARAPNIRRNAIAPTAAANQMPTTDSMRYATKFPPNTARTTANSM